MSMWVYGSKYWVSLVKIESGYSWLIKGGLLRVKEE